MLSRTIVVLLITDSEDIYCDNEVIFMAIVNKNLDFAKEKLEEKKVSAKLFIKIYEIPALL